MDWREEKLKEDIKIVARKKFATYWEEIVSMIIDDVVDDVVTTSDWPDYSDDDISLSIQRVIGMKLAQANATNHKNVKNIERYIKEHDSVEIVGVTILSKEEYNSYNDIIPEINNSWWLRSPGIEQFRAACVHSSGSSDYYSVNYAHYAVRPALIINLESSNLNIGDRFVFADKDWTVISDMLAICNSNIGTCTFRKNWEASNANVYEKSDLKKYVEDWFRRTMEETK